MRIYSSIGVILSILGVFCTESAHGFRRRWFLPLSEYVQSSASYKHADNSVQKTVEESHLIEDDMGNHVQHHNHHYYLRGFSDQ